MFSITQLNLMKKHGIDPKGGALYLEEQISNLLMLKGYDGHGNPTETGLICESIIDILTNSPNRLKI
ncbi:MAG: hypothetical protein Q4A55_00185 [Aerococcus sp.]|nr:hypothetical protein [Aerococcus sp.]